MRIGFVEVRERTRLLDEVALRLSDGNEIHWLVENHYYKPRHSKNVTLMRYPRGSKHLRKAQTPMETEVFASVARSDRAVVYFGKSTDHYAFYFDQIVSWLDETQPDIIFGEVSSFHGHLTSLIAKSRGIAFLSPITSRYPTGRMAFYLWDEIVPVGGEAGLIDESWLEETRALIVSGKSRPDYMSVRSSRVAMFLTRLRLTLEWFRGEKFNLQSPIGFFRKSVRGKIARQRWDRYSSSEAMPNSSHLNLLYPLQMQPELNLDVWGRDWRDQTRLVSELDEFAAREGYRLWVKPNPKSAYEMSPGMVKLLRNLKSTSSLPHSTRMEDIVNEMDLVVTVSGTIAIERALQGKPVVVLLDDYAAWLGLPKASEVVHGIHHLDADTVEALVAAQAAIDPKDVLRNLVRTSYPGIVSEPSLIPGVVSEENLKLLAAAFAHVAERYKDAYRCPATSL